MESFQTFHWASFGAWNTVPEVEVFSYSPRGRSLGAVISTPAAASIFTRLVAECELEDRQGVGGGDGEYAAEPGLPSSAPCSWILRDSGDIARKDLGQRLLHCACDGEPRRIKGAFLDELFWVHLLTRRDA